MPLEDRRLVCATSEDKERETESLPDVELAALNTCWNAIRNLEDEVSQACNVVLCAVVRWRITSYRKRRGGF